MAMKKGRDEGSITTTRGFFVRKYFFWMRTQKKWFKCQGPTAPKPVYIHLHWTPAIHPEIQTATSVLLQKLFLAVFEGLYDMSFSNEALDLHETTRPRLATTIVQLVTTPGLHFYRVPHLASIEGITPRQSQGRGRGPHR